MSGTALAIETPWPATRVIAQAAGEIDPYDPASAASFRGEEAFAPDVTGWRRWSKPSPEPRLDERFGPLLLEAISREAPRMNALVRRLAELVAEGLERAPLLVAVLRAGVPVGHLLAERLAERFGEPVPLVALSLFHGLGWDEAALEAALAAHPGRDVWFVDGWTSGGGVASELKASFARRLQAGRPDFTGGAGPRLAVLLDPGGHAEAAAASQDMFIPSACFTAPETLGFSRGFATEGGGLFHVYTFPRELLRPAYVEAWRAIHDAAPEGLAAEPAAMAAEAPPKGWRLHVNEVVRALINRDPREVWLAVGEAEAAERLAPVLEICRARGIPVVYDRHEVSRWGALAACRMGGA